MSFITVGSELDIQEFTKNLLIIPGVASYEFRYRNSRKEGMKVPHLLGDLSWDLIGSHRVLVRLLPEAEVEAGKGEREGDSKPHAEKDQHGGERHSP